MAKWQTALIDTNIWVDLYCPERPGHDAAQRFVDEALAQGVELACAVGSLKDLYYLIVRMLKMSERTEKGTLTDEAARAAEEVAWACLRNLQEIATVVGADGSDAWLAGKYRAVHRDFEDNLVVAAAERVGADVLVTNDEAFLRHCPVAAMDAMTALGALRAVAEM